MRGICMIVIFLYAAAASAQDCSGCHPNETAKYATSAHAHSLRKPADSMFFRALPPTPIGEACGGFILNYKLQQDALTVTAPSARKRPQRLSSGSSERAARRKRRSQSSEPRSSSTASVITAAAADSDLRSVSRAESLVPPKARWADHSIAKKQRVASVATLPAACQDR